MNANILKILILNTIWGVIIESRGCGPKFNGSCSCGTKDYYGKIQYIVNCTNEGFLNTDILLNLPLDTEVLIFTGNNIPEMPWNVFGTLNNLEKLRVVDMSNNRIKGIKGKAYHHVKYVERLILNHNELIISSQNEDDVNYHHPRVFSNFVNLLELHLTNAFEDNTSADLTNDLHDIFINSNLTKLYKLHLEQNEIAMFKDANVFCDLPQLHDLHLGDNVLTRLDFNISCLKNIRFLDLQNNKINALSKMEMSYLDKIYAMVKNDHRFSIDLNGNPFSCDCTMMNFISWLKRTNVTVKNAENLRCTDSKGLRNVSLLKLKTNYCDGVIKRSSIGKRLQNPVMIISVLSLVLIVVIAVMYAFSRKFQKKMAPLVDTFNRKIQYTTLKGSVENI